AKVGQPQIQILPITSDNQLSAEELKQSVVVKGQVSGLNASQLSTDQPIVFKLDGKSFKAKLDSTGTFSGIIDQ
ncbi:MAG TPA: MFS transporter, partial [Acinetobacter ursingii]|nr:MFS transporter [Acinetobacter ursingii]